MKANVHLKLLIALYLLASVGCSSGQDVAIKQGQPSSKESASGSVGQDSVSEKMIAPLIAADELRQLVEANSPGVKILEPAKSPEDFSQGHLSGAQFLHWVDDMTDNENAERYNKPKAEQFARLMSKLGIHNDDRIVIYDRLDSRLSTRLFWTLKYFGHKKVQVLDGGLEVWNSKSFPLSKEVAEVVESQYRVESVQHELLAEMELVESQRQDPNTRLIDGRPEAQFSGEQPGRVFHTHEAHSRKGHIPGAANIFWKDNFNEDGTFKSVKELRSLYANADVKPANGVITYCNEGLHAAPPWFVLTQLLNYENVRLYDSSMAEWADSKHPLETEVSGDSKSKMDSDK